VKNLQIEFYNSSTAAVNLNSESDSTSDTDYRSRQYYDVLTFANFALRMMRNLGNGSDTATLARMLSQWSYKPQILHETVNQAKPLTNNYNVLDSHVICTAAIEMGLPVERAKQLYGDPVILIPHTGQGKKRFLGTLTLSRTKPGFKLKTKGFGLTGKGIPQYGTDSLFVLLVYLVETHPTTNFLKAAKGLAAACGSAHLDGRITGINSESLALTYTNDWFNSVGII
jgi:hypothetical protein